LLKDGFLDATNRPKSWDELSALVIDYYAPAAEATKQLEEAIHRPYDQYPYAWEDRYHMLLPHLGQLKGFSLFAFHRAAAHAVSGDADETFRMLQLGIQLTTTGDDDLMVSRLVQLAQAHIVFSGICVAQQFHVGNDAQWQALARSLEAWDFPALMPSCRNAERAFGHVTILPMLNATPSEIMKQMGSWDGGAPVVRLPPLPDQDSGFGTLLRGFGKLLDWGVDAFVGNATRALVAQHWRKALVEYEEMIANVEKTLEKSRTAPWSRCDLPALKEPVGTYGIFAKLLFPPVDQAFQKSLQTQHLVELAKVAIALERFYLANQAYPEELAALSPNWLPAPPIDPMTRKAWRYERLDSKGFLLYSVGKDGVDHHGVYHRQDKDDLGWYISPTVPELPKFTIGEKDDAPPARNQQG